MMMPYVTLCCILTAIRTPTHAWSRPQKGTPLENRNIREETPWGREKRGMLTIATGVMKAIAVTKAILSQAKRVEIVDAHGILRRSYEKTGGYAQAKKDFDSFEPEHVQNYFLPVGGDGKMATVGNKVIILESWSWTGKPVMVIQSREGRTEIIDKITYTD